MFFFIKDLQIALKNSKRLPSFDYWRSFAVFVVVIGHFGDPHLMRGSTMDLAYLMSGALVSYDMLKLMAQDPKSELSWFRFYLRRGFKILPSYWCFLALGSVWLWLYVEPFAPQHLIQGSEWYQYLFFWRNYAAPPARLPFEHLWSLCVEEHCYWLLPLVLWGFKSLPKPQQQGVWYLLTLIFLVVLLRACCNIWEIAEWQNYTHNRLDSFLWGVLLACLQVYYPKQLKSWLNNAYCFWLGIFAITLVLWLQPDWDEHGAIMRTVAPMAWLAVVIGSYDFSSRYLFCLRVGAYYSYNIYLWHYLFLPWIFYHYGQTFTGFCWYLVCTLTAGFIFTTLIDQPFLKLRRFCLGSVPSKQQSL
ncbi:MAG: acyltransferase [Cytophagales bacterium]|nr:MAG: acyltransferase [Cytophagales bacterium]TAF62331.1 MAG: acyltransferase [Cytophagales bacterium]